MFVFMPLLQLFQVWSASRHNKTLLGIQNQTLTPEGFSTSSDAFNANFKWDAIHKAIETKHIFSFSVFLPEAHTSFQKKKFQQQKI